MAFSNSDARALVEHENDLISPDAAKWDRSNLRLSEKGAFYWLVQI